MEKHLTRHADSDANFFTALNTAFFQDGAFVSIPAGKTADKPVHLLFIGASEQAGAAVLPRNLILADRGATVKVIESHVSLSDAPRVTQLGDGIGAGGGRACGTLQGPAGERARFSRRDHSSGAGPGQPVEFAFHCDRIARLPATRSRRCSTRRARRPFSTAFTWRDGEQLIDHHTVVDHAKPHCESHEFYHGILADRAHGVFNGKIFVRQDAQKTNAKQTNRNLLLSDRRGH